MTGRSKGSITDEVGVVFEGASHFYRAIRKDRVSAVKELLRSGLIEALVAADLFPETELSLQTIDGFDLVLEHRRLDVLSYPYEWSPEMLRHAGRALLEVAELASRYGYCLKDAHPFNVVFDGTTPKFVDFGSFVQVAPDGSTSPQPMGQFVASFFFPLYFYSRGAVTIYGNAFLSPGQLLGVCDYLLFRYPIFRLLTPGALSSFELWYTRFHRFRDADLTRLSGVMRRFVWPAGQLQIRRRRRDAGKELRKARSRLDRLDLAAVTTWGNYQLALSDPDGPLEVLVTTERVQYVLDLVASTGVTTVLDLAGNRGLIADKVSQLPDIDRVICADYDEQAIDALFRRAVRGETTVIPAVLNFALPKTMATTLHPFERFHSDLVLALAVTHHLALGQGLRFDVIFEQIAQYSDRYVVVEFMPLGLFDGVTAPAVPAWYTRDAFLEALSHRFRILSEKQLEQNRVVFFCELSTARSRSS